MIRITWIPFTTAGLMLGLLLSSSAVAQTPTNANWTGGSGNWSDNSNWSSAGSPDNNASFEYDVSIDNGSSTNSVVNLNVGATIRSLTVDTGDTLNIENGNALSLQDVGNITNNGVVNIGGINGSTILNVGGGALIDGTGTINMASSSHSELSTNLTGESFTIGAGQTIQGRGDIGLNRSNIENFGVIETSSGVLTIDPNGSQSSFGFSNRNIIRASGTGVLRLSDGKFQNTGSIEVADDAVVELNNVTIQDGTLTSSGNGVFRVNNWQQAQLDGFITNNARIEIGGINGSTSLTYGDNTMLDGTGTISLGNANLSNFGAANAGDKLTLGANQTISGRGHVGVGNSAITSNGIVDANVSNNRLVLSTGSETFVNNNIIRASGGGILRLGDGVIDNTQNGANGTIEAGDGSVVELAGAGIKGGTLNSTGSGFFRIQNGKSSEILSSITNNASIEILGTNAETSLVVSNGRAFSGTGNITLTNQNLSVVSGDFNNDDDHTIRGTGRVGDGLNEINNSGVIEASSSGNVLAIEADDLYGLGNTGTLRAVDGGVLRLNGGLYLNSGTIRAEDNSQVEIAGGAKFSGGTFDSAGTGTFEVRNGNSGTISYLTNNSTVNIGGLNAATGLNFEGNQELSGNGTINLMNQNLSFLKAANANDQLINGNSHTIAGAGQLGEGGSIFNLGTIRADGGGTLRLRGVTQNFGLVEVNGGTLSIEDTYLNNGVTLLAGGQTINATTLIEITSGLLAGDGSINGDVRLNGTIRAGYSVGQIGDNLAEVAGEIDITNLDMDQAAISEFEIGGLASGTEFDFLDVSNNLELDGELSLSLINGFESLIQGTDTFTIMDSVMLTGGFDNVANGESLLVEDGSGFFQVNYGAGSAYSQNSVVLSNFSAVPEPAQWFVVLLLAMMSLLVRSRKINATGSLQ